MNPTTSTELIVDLQLASNNVSRLPDHAEIIGWAQSAFNMVLGINEAAPARAELTIRIVDVPEMQMLNQDYRGKTGPTNVLSFAIDESDMPINDKIVGNSDEPSLLGDVVICAPVVESEALAQSKTFKEHFAHMVTHGVLHLCGYDHQTDLEAAAMESLETRILLSQGIDNPYGESSYQ